MVTQTTTDDPIELRVATVGKPEDLAVDEGKGRNSERISSFSNRRPLSDCESVCAPYAIREAAACASVTSSSLPVFTS